MDEAKATIRITRGSDYFGVLRKLKVYINQEHRGGVKHNSSLDIHVTPGMYQVYVKMDWCRSKPVTPHLSDGDIIEYEVRMRSQDSIVGMFRSLYDLVFNFSDFFELREQPRTNK
ncbi:MAG: hypothetical protein U5J95_02515 [Balneolaceae bacterium]|nr:hypothetical protein [Balneolaceae bacterium]